ncbi:MAG: tetratricopeptide repeat protein [Bacteroidetes Order II. Incertae sedis bacterium]|nr:tetratricopeptide repeat protein [Bacteroidetes Order II. bacterium]
MRHVNWLFLLILVFYAGCSGMQQTKPPKVRLLEYERLLVKNPGNPVMMRELGIAHFELNQFDQAESYLKDAIVRSPADPKIALFYGLVLEATNRRASALDIYKGYSQYDPKVNFTRLLEGRYLNLTRAILRSEIAELARKETSGELTNGRLEQNAVAVFPFNYLGKNKQYEPLSRGIAALIITDLGSIQGLKLLERLQIGVLQQEIARGQTGFIDPESAPRAGRILGASKVVSGNFNVSAKQQITIDAGYWDVLKDESDFKTEPGPLSDLFRLQKSVVIKLLESMKIPITAQERQKILGTVPTQNLQAFLAYCRGMEAEDAGDVLGALRNFRRAVELDPKFQKARELLDKNINRQAAGSSWKDINISYDFNGAGKNGGSGLGTDQLVADRLQAVGTEMGSNLFPNPEKRNPTDEFGRISEQADLPRPPSFPPKGN